MTEHELVDNAGEGVSGIILSKKGKKRKEAAEAERRKRLEEFGKMEKVKIRATMSVAGIYLDHPDEKGFSCAEGNVILMPKAQAKSLIKAGQFEKAG